MKCAQCGEDRKWLARFIVHEMTCPPCCTKKCAEAWYSTAVSSLNGNVLASTNAPHTISPTTPPHAAPPQQG